MSNQNSSPDPDSPDVAASCYDGAYSDARCGQYNNPFSEETLAGRKYDEGHRDARRTMRNHKNWSLKFSAFHILHWLGCGMILYFIVSLFLAILYASAGVGSLKLWIGIGCMGILIFFVGCFVQYPRKDETWRTLFSPSLITDDPDFEEKHLTSEETED